MFGHGNTMNLNRRSISPDGTPATIIVTSQPKSQREEAGFSLAVLCSCSESDPSITQTKDLPISVILSTSSSKRSHGGAPHPFEENSRDKFASSVHQNYFLTDNMCAPAVTRSSSEMHLNLGERSFFSIPLKFWTLMLLMISKLDFFCRLT